MDANEREDPALNFLPAVISAGMALVIATAAQADESAAWSEIAYDLFGHREIAVDEIVALDAPYRAEDAAIVPLTVSFDLPPGDDRRVTALTLVIDENPAPVAGTFTFGPEAQVSTLSTRVRINAYTPVRAVAELSDGSLHMAASFVKASGGCSAPMAKNPAQALADIGEIRLRQFDADQEAPARAEAQLMIRHPNRSGLQRDPVSLLYIPAHFVRDLTVRQGDDLVLRMEGGISISEDPNLRFDFARNGSDRLSVEAIDTEDAVFEETWRLDRPAGS